MRKDRVALVHTLDQGNEKAKTKYLSCLLEMFALSKNSCVVLYQKDASFSKAQVSQSNSMTKRKKRERVNNVNHSSRLKD